MQNKNISPNNTQQNLSLSSKEENTSKDEYTIIKNETISMETFLEIEKIFSWSKNDIFPVWLPGNQYLIKTNDMYFEMKIINEDFRKTYQEYIIINTWNNNDSFIFNTNNNIVPWIDKVDIILNLNDDIDTFNIKGYILKNKKLISIDINRYSGIEDTHYDENKDIYKLYTYPLIKECLEQKPEICTDKWCNSKDMTSCIWEKITKNETINALVTDYVTQVLNVINSLDI